MPDVQAARALETLPAQWEVVHLAQKLRPHLPRLYERYGIETLELFGSYVRNEQRPESDLDVLVSFARTPTFIDRMDLEDEIAGIVGVKVDLVLRSNLRPRIGRVILREAVVL